MTIIPNLPSSADVHAEIFDERRLQREERNAVVNALIDTAVLTQEKLDAENHALRDTIERLELRLTALQESTLLQALLKSIPSPVKRVLRYVRQYAHVSYLRSSRHFDEAWYLTENPDVAEAGIDPTRHYVFHGFLEGRNPHPGFNTKAYLANREKTRRPRRNPFVEYLKWHKGGRLLSVTTTVNAVSSDLTVIQNNSPSEPISTVVKGWYGANLLSSDQLFEYDHFAMVDSAICAAQTDRIIDRYLMDVELDNSPSATTNDKYAPLALIREALSNSIVSHDVERSVNPATYTIVTPFYENLKFFARCAESVECLLATENAQGSQNRVEWIILNDDPRVDAVTLLNALPEAIQPMTLIISDGLNVGISARQNQGIHSANNDWILFLNCDDQLAPNCTTVLDHYINEFPYCRLISSAMVDIDENGVELRRRIYGCDVGGLFENGMDAGHLLAVRSDLFSDMGGFDHRFTGCQDYDLALRAAIREPILLVPDHLYAYRWHSRSQSVSQRKRQARTAEAVRKAFLQYFLDSHWPTEHYPATVLTKDSVGICLIRTQGHRFDLLEEAVNSVLAQTVCITPCIIVHGNELAFDVVSEWARKFANRVQLLHASSTGLRRGYPLNIGLDFVEQNAEKYDFFCILDDDDIYYPLFSERLIMALSLTASDVVYCITNSRVPGQQAESEHPPLPTSCLVAANFIPINAYVVRTTLLVKSGARLREDINYLEDWDFLLSLLYAGGKFSLLNETLAEYRIISDGNTLFKKDPAHFEHCNNIVAMRGAFVARQLGMGHFYRDVLDFDFSLRPDLPEQSNQQIDAASDIFALKFEPVKLTNLVDKSKLTIANYFMGGIGNQLFQHVFGKSLALKLDADLLYDISFYNADPYNNQSVLYLIDPQAKITEVDKLESTFIASDGMLASLDDQMYLPDDTKVLVLYGYWQNERLLDRSVVEETYFALVKSQRAVDKSDMARDIASHKDTLAIHFRRHDYAHMGLCEESYYVDAIDLILKRFPGARLYVFSDEPNYAQHFLDQRYPSAIMVSSGGDLADLYLMSLCKHFVIANSTYSWWGAYFAESKGGMIVCPKEWITLVGVESACPDRWIKLSQSVRVP